MRVNVRVSWVIFMGMVAIVGCQNSASEDKAHDADSQDLSRMLSRAKDDEVRQRINLALSMSRNGVVDSVPVLLNTVLTTDSRSGQWHLGMVFYDEDMDTIGLGVNERHVAADGSTATVVEEYPIFIHNRQGPGEALTSFRRPVHVRDSDQRKDEAQWREFCVEGKGPLESGARSREEYARTLPPVYISIPVANRVEVSIYLYDSAGHRSDLVKLSTHASKSSDTSAH